jgi:hypothetical protein
VDRLFRWIEQFDSHLDWQRDDPFFELESVVDWTDDPAPVEPPASWGLDDLAVA